MRVLVACEWSGVVRDAFRRRGHEAYSCDLLPASGGRPEYHIQDDVMRIMDEKDKHNLGWGLIIAFPPCTHLASSGARWFKEKRESGEQQAAIDFFMEFTAVDCPKVAIENPIGVMSTYYRKPDQIIQPWQFGHGETKATCLWLKRLPKLKPTNIVEGREQRVWKMGPSPDRAKLRGLTYSGIADAMADQWAAVDLRKDGEK